MSNFEIQGLEEFQEKLRLVEKKAPDRILDKLDDEGKKLRKEIRNNTPVDSGKLKKSYKLAPVEKVKGGYQKGIYSNSPFFHLVERGYIQTTPSGKELGWKPGVFMVEKTLKQQEEPLMNGLKLWLDDLFKELS